MPTARSPEPENRVRDAERTKRALLDAAFDEFSARGYAGARVGEIATRAGVNKQLITYYFGGKEGLYRALQQRWQDREAEFADPEAPLAEVAVRYLQALLVDPRGIRMLMWRSLSGDGPGAAEVAPDDLTRMQGRQARGEIAADLDPASFQLALMGMVTAPLLLPQVVLELFETGPQTKEFEQRYAEQLRRILAHLAQSHDDPQSHDDQGEDS